MDFKAASAFGVGDLIHSVAERGGHLIGHPRVTDGAAIVLALAEVLMSGRGEAPGTALAEQMLGDYGSSPQNERQQAPLAIAHRWLRALAIDDSQGLLTAEDRRALRFTKRPARFDRAAAVQAVNRMLLPLASHHVLRARTPSGRVVDPMARLHLGNGARLERLNPLVDRSPKGLATSFGLMDNYRYDPAAIEANHELFANRGEVIAAAVVRKLLRRPVAGAVWRARPHERNVRHAA